MSDCKLNRKRIVKGRPNGVRERLRNLFGRESAWSDDVPAERVEQPTSGVSPMDSGGFVYAMESSELPSDGLVDVNLQGISVCMTMLDGAVIAFENDCPHAGGPLSDGEINDGKVRCPLHGWEFDLRTGRCDVGDGFQLNRLPVKSINSSIFVELT